MKPFDLKIKISSAFHDAYASTNNAGFSFMRSTKAALLGDIFQYLDELLFKANAYDAGTTKVNMEEIKDRQIETLKEQLAEALAQNKTLVKREEFYKNEARELEHENVKLRSNEDDWVHPADYMAMRNKAEHAFIELNKADSKIAELENDIYVLKQKLEEECLEEYVFDESYTSEQINSIGEISHVQFECNKDEEFIKLLGSKGHTTLLAEDVAEYFDCDKNSVSDILHSVEIHNLKYNYKD